MGKGISIIVLIGLLFSSCSRKNYLIIDYDNTTGKTPKSFYFQSSKNVDFDDDYPKANITDGQTVTITVKDLKIGDKNNNYGITKYTISECITENGKCKDGDWRVQAEFDKEDSSLKTNINAVLVLDVSNSLEDNIGLVKSSAKNFARTILNSSPSSTVGLVLFSKEIKIIEFEKKQGYNKLSSNIDNYTIYEDRTTLYEASMEGLRMLERSTHKGAKNLIIFTDGGDNNSDNPIQLKNKLLKSNINRFAIGLEGKDFDEKALKELATKNSNFVLAKSIDDLEAAFGNIAKQVKTVYKLDYKRSDQKLDRPIYIKYDFEIEKQK